MHPNPNFAWTNRSEMLDFMSRRAFAHIFVSGPTGARVLHAPVIVTDAGRVQFHVARRNRAAATIADQEVLISVSGRDAYQSANWYVSDDQVPTWHYEAVEVEGRARIMGEPELVAHLDLLSDTMERRFSPERPWTRDKMTAGKFEAMIKAIIGFEIDPIEIRGTRKFNQHKSAGDRAATIAGQRAAGRADVVAAIHEAASGG
ncbi:MAG: FMN-binding negative transcriptional regulator [Sphingomicrobium sp.]